ncbi:MAG TPA: ABC transporter permease subunit [Candidatus Binatia bacterium]|nr:ABC transporter permease subunit [Candidatus Binatia bacterium]
MTRGVRVVAWAAVAILAIAPLAMLFAQGASSLGAIAHQSSFLKTTLNTITLGLLVALFSLVLGASLAAVEATMPPAGAAFVFPLVLVPYLLPPYLTGLAWNALLQQNGLVFLATGWQPAWATALLYSLPGIALVMASHLYPLVYLMFRGYQQNRSARLLWSARVHGASQAYAFRRVVIPDVLPVVAATSLLTFIAGIEEFGVPSVLGGYAGITVLTTQVQEVTAVWPVDLGKGAAYSLVLLVLAAGAWVPFRIFSRERTTDASAARRSGKTSLWGTCAFSLCGLVTAVVPVAAVITLSLMRAQTNGLRAGNFTFAHFAAIAAPESGARAAFWTSLQLAFETTLAAAILGFAVAYALRCGGRGTVALDLASALPNAAPGIVLAVGIILVWNAPWNPLPVYNHLGILLVGYTTVVFPTALRYAQLGLAKIPARWEWAAAVHGADPLRTLWAVVVPLARPAVVAGMPILFGLAMRELVMSIMLQPPGVQTISTYVLAQFEQGDIGNSMAMAVTGVFTSAAIIGAFEFFGSKGDADAENVNYARRAAHAGNGIIG